MSKSLQWITISLLVLILVLQLTGCASGPQLAINSIVSQSMPAHDYAYAGPYQFQSGAGGQGK